MANASVATDEDTDIIEHWPPHSSDTKYQGLSVEPLADLVYDHDPRHPEHERKDLIWGPHSLRGHRVGNYAELRAKQGRPAVEENRLTETHEICSACGWTNYHQIHSSYSPRVRIHHTRQNMGLWDLAGQWVLRDEPNDTSKSYDFMTQKFLREQTGLDVGPGGDVPLVAAQIALSRPEDKVNLTLMRQADGYPLDYMWPRASPAQRVSYMRQMANVIRSLRQFTRPSAQKVDGTLLDDFIIGHCKNRRAPSCTKIGPFAEDWLDNLAPSLRGGLSFKYKTNDAAIIDAKLAELRATFPSGGPYYLTHGDLNMSNIIVKDDKIHAIIDWEMAGFYPWWVERALSLDYTGFSREIYGPMWEMLEPEVTHQKMTDDVYWPVDQVTRIFRRCNVKHPGEDAVWLRPAFSECESAAGEIRWSYLGNVLEHQVCDEQWGAKDPNYPYGEGVGFDFDS